MEDRAPFDDVELELIAHNPARNIHRRYAIRASVDLFGAVIVETRWGRIGASGQHKARSFARGAEADHYVRAILARRKSATTRLGTAYQIQNR